MGIKLTKKQKRYLRKNYRHNSDASLAKQLGKSEKFIRLALKQLHLERSEAEIKALQAADNKKWAKKDKKNGGRSIIFFRKPLFYLIIGVVLVAVILLYSLLKYQITKEGKYINEIKKLMAPLNVSELNILFITLDTTRADHLGCYGYDKVETPNMDRVAETGILFKNAICQSPLTLPSEGNRSRAITELYGSQPVGSGLFREKNAGKSRVGN